MDTPAQNLWTSPDSAELDEIQLEASDFAAAVVLRKVPYGDAFEAARAGDVERLRYLVEDAGVDVNARDRWDSAALYYACLAGHLDAARLLLESGAICSEHTFDGDRCHYAALNLKVRKLLKSFEARPPPLPPLHAALRDLFLASPPNLASPIPLSAGLSPSSASSSSYFPPDIVFIVQGRPVEAHKVILSVRSPFFRKKFETDWRDRREVRFGREKLSYAALYSLIHFFYSDRLEIAVDDMEDLVRICKVCQCESLRRVLEKELVHQKYAEYKALRDVDNSQKRFIFQGTSLPEEDRLPSSLRRILQASLANSNANNPISDKNGVMDELISRAEKMNVNDLKDDLADVCIRVEGRISRCHQVVLASRSDYFKARLSRMMDFHEGKDGSPVDSLPCIDEHDLSTEAFEKMVEFMYTDGLTDIDPDQAEEIFDAASRYLLFPLKRAVADVLLPHLETASPEELCHWLILSDMYGVAKIREHCLDEIALDFETFAECREFRAMLLTLPPPSGDSMLRTTVPSAPGAELSSDQANLLDDLREKWLEAEAGELDERDESALIFDKRLEMLMIVAEREKSDENSGNRD